MGASIKAWELTYIDLSEDNVGDFSHIDPYDDDSDAISQKNLAEFFESPVGQAQRDSLIEEMKAQMAAQGVDDYEPTDRAIVSALRSGQNSQKYGGSPDITNEKMLENHGPAWYEKVGTLVSNFFGAAEETASGLAHDGLGQVVDGVTNNDGMAGQAADAVRNRQEQLDAEIERQVNGPAAGNLTM